MLLSIVSNIVKGNELIYIGECDLIEFFCNIMFGIVYLVELNEKYL